MRPSIFMIHGLYEITSKVVQIDTLDGLKLNEGLTLQESHMDERQVSAT